jgi:hypothetical protein
MNSAFLPWRASSLWAVVNGISRYPSLKEFEGVLSVQLTAQESRLRAHRRPRPRLLDTFRPALEHATAAWRTAASLGDRPWAAVSGGPAASARIKAEST